MKRFAQFRFKLVRGFVIDHCGAPDWLIRLHLCVDWLNPVLNRLQSSANTKLKAIYTFGERCT